MKKIYSKPEIIFEDFALSTNIAGNCEVKINNPTNNTCGYELEGYGTIFTSKISGCAIDFDNGFVYMIDENGNTLCYHNPSEAYNLFNS